MIFSCILLAICSTLDSFGIGITYGLKNIKILFKSKIVLFVSSLFITLSSIILGNFLDLIFKFDITNFLGSVILIIIGTCLLFSFLKKENNFDLDNSKKIDTKEALYLGFALSLDAFGIGISSSMLNLNVILLPILISVFQLLFLSFGNYLGRKIKRISHISDNIWSIIAGSLLIIIGVIKLF